MEERSQYNSHGKRLHYGVGACGPGPKCLTSRRYFRPIQAARLPLNDTGYHNIYAPIRGQGGKKIY